MAQELKQLEGYFLTFNREEQEIIEEALHDAGYTFDAAGIKNYLLDSIENGLVENEKPNPVDKIVQNIADAVNKNPEQVKAYANIAGSVIFNFLKKKAASR